MTAVTENRIVCSVVAARSFRTLLAALVIHFVCLR